MDSDDQITQPRHLFLPENIYTPINLLTSPELYKKSDRTRFNLYLLKEYAFAILTWEAPSWGIL